MLGLGRFLCAPVRHGPEALLNQQATTPHLHTPAEAAERLRRTPATLRNWRWRGEGPDYIRYGGRVHYTDEALSRWLAAHEVRPEGVS